MLTGEAWRLNHSAAHCHGRLAKLAVDRPVARGHADQVACCSEASKSCRKGNGARPGIGPDEGASVRLYLPDASQRYLETTKPLQEVVLGSYHPVTSGACVEKANYCPQVLPFTWRVHLPLAGRLQGWHRVVCANLAGKD